MVLNILGFWLLGDEDVGEDNGDDEENNDQDQALTQPTFGSAHPRDTSVFLFLGTF